MHVTKVAGNGRSFLCRRTCHFAQHTGMLLNQKFDLPKETWESGRRSVATPIKDNNKISIQDGKIPKKKTSINV